MQQIGSLLQNLLIAQHVSCTIMPIIRSSRVIQMAAACSTWLFGLQVVGLVWSCGLCARFEGYYSTADPGTTGSSHLYNSRAPDDEHNGARNMFNK